MSESLVDPVGVGRNRWGLAVKALSALLALGIAGACDTDTDAAAWQLPATHETAAAAPAPVKTPLVAPAAIHCQAQDQDNWGPVPPTLRAGPIAAQLGVDGLAVALGTMVDVSCKKGFRTTALLPGFRVTVDGIPSDAKLYGQCYMFMNAGASGPTTHELRGVCPTEDETLG